MNKTYLERVLAFAGAKRWRELFRWLVVAAAFSAASIFFLFLFVTVLRVPLIAATLLAAEVATLLRFFVTNRWVFRCNNTTWLGLWQFHCANALTFAVWWALTNAMSHYGVYYLIAATVAMAGSSGVSLLTNFLWIWRSPTDHRPALPIQESLPVPEFNGRDNL